MTTMLQRIRELSQFDVEKPTIEDTEFLTACYPEFKKDPIQESIAGLNGFLHGFKSGRDSENARLLPLIDALIQAVEVSEKALHCNEEICEISGGCYNCEARASMQSILEKAMK